MVESRLRQRLDTLSRRGQTQSLKGDIISGKQVSDLVSNAIGRSFSFNLKQRENPILVERKNEKLINRVLSESQKLLDINYEETLVKEGINQEFFDYLYGDKIKGQHQVSIENNFDRKGQNEQTQKIFESKMCRIPFASETALSKFFLRF